MAIKVIKTAEAHEDDLHIHGLVQEDGTPGPGEGFKSTIDMVTKVYTIEYSSSMRFSEEPTVVASANSETPSVVTIQPGASVNQFRALVNNLEGDPVQSDFWFIAFGEVQS